METMRTLLRGNLGRSLRAMSPEDRLAAAWPVACGQAMAAHGEVTGLFEGTVSIEVEDAAWLRQMMSMRGVLERELAQIAAVPLTGIHFTLRR